MKKVFSLTVFLLTCFLFLISQTKADSCSYKEQQALNKEASNVKINYEIVDRRNEIPNNLTQDDHYDMKDYYYINVSLYNISENIYVKITNDYNNEEKNYYSTDLVENSISWKNFYNYQNITYTLNILANTTNCSGKKLIRKKITIPRFNQFYNKNYCQKIPDYELCQELINSSLDDSKVADKIYDAYLKTLNFSNQKDENNKFKINWQLIITIAGIIILGVITGLIIYIVIKRRRIV